MALAQIEKSHGKGAIMRLGDLNGLNVETVSTGSMALDLALGVGGLPRGRIVEIFGPEGSGKTTVSLHVIAEAQKAGGLVAFIDAEHALDPTYAKALGVDIDNLLVDRKSTRLNSSHGYISYAVFCLKKKTKNKIKSTLHNLSQ